jgi:hypothetical protein
MELQKTVDALHEHSIERTKLQAETYLYNCLVRICFRYVVPEATSRLPVASSI